MLMKTIIIQPVKNFLPINFKELWDYRELVYFLTWKDVTVKYKQTVIGILWAVIQPLMAMLIFTIFFGQFAKIPSEGVPYPIFVYTGLLLWQFFVSSLNDIANSLINNQSIVSKVYFPRLILPLSYTLNNFVDFVIGTIILIILMIYYGYTPSLNILLVLP